MADATRLEELRAAVRSYLAWRSIWEEKEELNLDEVSRRQAQTQREHFNDTVTQRIHETYTWALVPTQAVGSAEIIWETHRVPGSDPLPARIAKKLSDNEQLITSLGGVRLRMELDGIPLWDGEHVSTHQLWSYFAQDPLTCRASATGSSSPARSSTASPTSHGNTTPSPTRRASTRRRTAIEASSGATTPRC